MFPKNLALVGAAVAVLVVGGIVAAFALGGDDGDAEASGSSTPEGRDVAAGQEPGGGGGQGDPGVDAVAEAEAIVEAGFVRASSVARECLVDAFAADDELRGVLEGQTVFEIGDDAVAANYSSTVMGCMSSSEMVRELEYALAAEGLDDYQMGCVTSEASAWSSGDWEEFLALSVAPHRTAELEQVLMDIFTFC